MLLEILVQVGNSSIGLDFGITQSLCGMQEHGCVYSVGMSTVKKSTFTFVMFICLSIHTYQHDFLWMYFCEI